MSRHFDTLGLEPDATTAEIRAAYKKLALKWHPDKNDAFNARLKFQEICEAYMALSNEEEDNNVELDDFYEGDGLGFGRGPDDVLFAAMFAEMRAHGFRAFGRGCTGGHPEHFNMNPYDDPLLHHHHSCPHHHLHHHTLAATKPFNGRHTHTHINGYSGIHTQHGHHSHVDEEDEDDTTPSDPVVPTLAPPTCSPADDHIHVTWCAPTLPSSTAILPISLYYLEMKITKTYQLVYEGSAIQYTVPNLLPGTKYTFRLSATAGGTYAHLGKLKFTSAVPCTTTGVRDTQSKQAHPPVLSNLQLEAKDKKDRARDKKKKQQERSEKARKAAEEEAAKVAAEAAKKQQGKKGGAISNGTTSISTSTSSSTSSAATSTSSTSSTTPSATPSSETSSTPTATSTSTSSSVSLTTTPSTTPLTAKQIKAQNEEEKRQKKLQEEMEYQKFILQRRKELELEALAAEQRELEAFQAAKKAASLKEAEAAAQAKQAAAAAAAATQAAQTEKNKQKGSPAAATITITPTAGSTPSKLGQSSSQPNLPSPSSAAAATFTSGSSSSRVPSSQGSPSLRGTPSSKNPRSVSKPSTLTSSPIQTPARGMSQSPSTSLSGLSTPTSTSSTLSDDGSADADDDVGGMNKPLSRSQRRRRKKKTEAAENGSPPATAATISAPSTSASSATSTTSSHVVTPIASPAADKSPALRGVKPATQTQQASVKNPPSVKSLTTPATTASTATTITSTTATTAAPVSGAGAGAGTTTAPQPFSYAARVAGLSASNSSSSLPTPSMTPISISPPSLSPSTSTSNMPLPLPATPTATTAAATTTTSASSSGITGPISFSAIVANKHRSSMTSASTSVTPITSTSSPLSMSSSQPLLPMPTSFSTPVSASTSTSTLPTSSTTRHSLSASASPTISSRHTTLSDESINIDTMLRAFEQAKRLYQETISIRTHEYDGWNNQQDVGISDANEMGYSPFGYNNNTTTTTTTTTAPLSPSFPSFHPFQIRSAGVIDDERHAHLTPSSSSSSLLDPVFDPVHTLGRTSSGSHSGVASSQHTPSQHHHHLNVAGSGSGSSPRPIYDPSASSTTSSSTSSSTTATPSYRGFHSAFGSSPFLPIGSGSPASSHSSLSKSSSSFSLPSTSFSPYIHSSVASNSPSSSSRHTSMTDDTYEHIRHDHDHGVDDDVDLISLTKHVMLDDMEEQHHMEKEWNHTDIDASTSMYHNYSAGFGLASSAFSTYGQTYGHTGFSLQSSSYDLPSYDTHFDDDYGTLPDDPQLAAVADVLDNNDS